MPSRTPHEAGERQTAGPSRAIHAMMCVWFWAWAGVGALGMLSLDLGPLAFLPALVLGGLVATRGDASYGSAFGVLTGAGLPLLFVAYVQRDGPGTTCYRTAVATGCAQHLNPVPWLVVGITLVLAGLLTQKHRSRRVEITSAGSRCDGP